MGFAGVIPGLSASSIALTTGIYQPIASMLNQFREFFVSLVLQRPVKNTKPALQGILVISLGILTGCTLLRYLFGLLPEQLIAGTLAFAFGMMVFATYRNLLSLRLAKRSTWLFISLGIVLVAASTWVRPMPVSNTIIDFIVCGLVLSAALLIPGISAMGVMLFMGCYPLLLAGMGVLSLTKIGSLILGILAGLIIFSFLLHFLFTRFAGYFNAFLCGCLVISLKTLWPWKVPMLKIDNYGNFVTNSAGQRVISGYRSYLPPEPDATNLLIAAIVLAGLLFALFLSKYLSVQNPPSCQNLD